MKKSKRLRASIEKLTPGGEAAALELRTLDEAAAAVAGGSGVKFDESIDIADILAMASTISLLFIVALPFSVFIEILLFCEPLHRAPAPNLMALR